VQPLKLQTSRGDYVSVDLQDVPDECPLCHHHVHAELLAASIKHPPSRREVEIAFRCTRDECQAVFVGYYKGQRTEPSPTDPEPYALVRTAPIMLTTEEFSEEIRELSPTFVAVYNQALAAEGAGLDQLTGIGLRKALEFLVKDLAIWLRPDAKTEIEKAYLGVCIDRFIDDVHLKECARRAVWLANDETHYMRKWNDKDITDLKRLARLTINWAENVILTKRYVDKMQ